MKPVWVVAFFCTFVVTWVFSHWATRAFLEWIDDRRVRKLMGVRR